jgi:predicted transcriptional regulator
MPVVERTQISLDAAQAARLRRLARERGTSMAALIRDAVDQTYPEDEDSIDARWERALAVVGKFDGGPAPAPAGERSWLDDEFVASIYQESHPPDGR